MEGLLDKTRQPPGQPPGLGFSTPMVQLGPVMHATTHPTSIHGDLVRQPPRDRADHAGADDLQAEVLASAMGTALSAQLEPAIRQGLTPLGNVLESVRRQNEDDKVAVEGTMGYLRGHTRWYV